MAIMALLSSDSVSALRMERRHHHHKKHHAWPNTSEPPRPDENAKAPTVDIPNGWQGPFVKHSTVQTQEGDDDKHNWNPVNAVLGPFGPTHNAQMSGWPYTSEASKPENPGEGKSVSVPNAWQGPFSKSSQFRHEPKTGDHPDEVAIFDVPNAWSGPLGPNGRNLIHKKKHAHKSHHKSHKKSKAYKKRHELNEEIKDEELNENPHSSNKLQLLSDPICASAECPDVHLSAEYRKPKYPVDYAVPNFGVDHDIVGTQSSEAQASESNDHVWNPAWDPKAEKFIVPTEDAEFKLIQTQSDPNFNSHDGYFLNHSPEETKQQKATPEYDFNPTLDEDILHAHEHFEAAGGAKLG